MRELSRLDEDTLERHLTPDEEDQLSLVALTACHERFLAQELDLSSLNVAENAADVDALRAALGYDRLNLYGVSYGSRLALQTMRWHADVLRSVVLDGVYPPQADIAVSTGATGNRAFGVLFDACAADADCNRAYPDLERVFFDLSDRLDREPARVAVTQPKTERHFDAVLTGTGLRRLVFQTLYVTEALPILPRAIYAARDGDFRFFSVVWPLFVFDDSMSRGMYYSAVCAETAGTPPDAVPVEGLRPAFARDARQGAAWFRDACSTWNVGHLAPEAGTPVASAVPTLLLSGKFDPVTPPDFAAEAARSLSASQSVTFPTTGHGAFTSNACANALVGRFLAEPAATVDAGCIEPTLSFVTPTTRLLIPLDQLIGMFTPPWSLAGFTVPISLLIVLSFLLIWPVGALVRLVRRRRGATQLAARLAPWLMALFTVVATVYYLLLFGMVNSLLGETGIFTPFYGLPLGQAGHVAPADLFVPAPLLGLFALGLLALAVTAWRSRAWTIVARTYFTLVALAAVTMIATLPHGEMIAALARRVLGGG